MNRGEIWWADLPVPGRSEPGYRRPVLIVQSDGFNRSRIRTVVALAITSNLRLAEAPGNVSLARRGTGLPRTSVINVSQIMTLDKEYLIERAGRASDAIMGQVEESLRMLLGLHPMS
ncbi:MAG: type II toxin-antitoxin system PemK/MazF family toxin [Deltaproteobacteria bacterium]|nr:type II toxin-antitoxin system PemK/MazF family toxin [Deltaproteobacteria bacterium]